MLAGPEAVSVNITNVLYKLAGFSAVVVGADGLMPGLYGPTFWHAIPAMGVTVFVLTLVGGIADLLLVPRIGNLPSLAIGWFGVTAIIWFIAAAWPHTQMTLVRASVIGIFAAPIEYALHKFVLSHHPSARK